MFNEWPYKVAAQFGFQVPGSQQILVKRIKINQDE
jgi:hypothetical protein